MLAHRHLDVLADGQAGKQRAFLEEDAPALADQEPLVRPELVDIVAEDFDRARLLVDEPEDGPGQDRLARARCADEAEHLAAIEVEVESVHDQAVAEAHLEATDADDGLAPLFERGWPTRVQ